MKLDFCDDLFINLIREYHLYFNDVELQYGNDKFLNFELKSSQDWDKFSHEDWKSYYFNFVDRSLEKRICFSLYSHGLILGIKSDSFPLNLCGHNDRLEHIIEFKLKLL